MLFNFLWIIGIFIIFVIIIKAIMEYSNDSNESGTPTRSSSPQRPVQRWGRSTVDVYNREPVRRPPLRDYTLQVSSVNNHAGQSLPTYAMENSVLPNKPDITPIPTESAFRKCHNCGYNNEIDSLFCSNCGTEL